MSILSLSVGLDYHDDTVRVCILEQDGVMLVNRDVDNDTRAVRDSAWVQPAVERLTSLPNFIDRRNGPCGWLMRGMKARDKTDRRDAWLLADLARVKYLPEVWLADEETGQLSGTNRDHSPGSQQVDPVDLLRQLKRLLEEPILGNFQSP